MRFNLNQYSVVKNVMSPCDLMLSFIRTTKKFDSCQSPINNRFLQIKPLL